MSQAASRGEQINSSNNKTSASNEKWIQILALVLYTVAIIIIIVRQQLWGGRVAGRGGRGGLTMYCCSIFSINDHHFAFNVTMLMAADVDKENVKICNYNRIL